MKYSGIPGVGLTLNYDTVADATAAFTAPGVEGRVTMPRPPMFWGGSSKRSAIARACPATEWATIEVRELGPCFE